MNVVSPTNPPHQEAPKRPASPAADKARDLLATLIQTFPACFKPQNVRDVAPFKVGIRNDILDLMPHLSTTSLHKAIHLYVGRPDYLRSLIAGRPRIDLDGNITQAVITPEEISHAKQKLDAILERKRARREQEVKIASSAAHSPLPQPPHGLASANHRPILSLPTRPPRLSK